MAYNPNQLKPYDVILGGRALTPVNGLVLGGLPGVKRRLASPISAQRVAALREIPNYGKSGFDLAILALKDCSWQVRQAAYSLLEDYKEPTIKQALQEYNPYQLFECLYIHATAKFTANSVTISPDGQLLVSGGNDKTVSVRSLSNGRILRTLKGHSGSVYTVVISPDSQTLISGSWDNTIKVWDLGTVSDLSGNAPTNRVVGGGLRFTLSGHVGEVNSVVSLDGQIASGSEDSTINLWDLSTGELRTTLAGHADGVKSVAVSPDGKIASGSADETIKLWHISTGELLHTLTAHANGVKSVAISPNGKILASGGQDRTIKLWQMHTGELIRTLEGHWGEVNSVAISSDGQTLVSGSRDETIRIWHLATGVQLHSLEGHQNGVATIAISPDGQQIVSSSWDNTIRVWGAR